MLACSAMVACTNEDVLENIDNPVVKGDKAYVVVSIKNANGVSSRGTAGDTEFSDGIAAENEVKTSTFFFYDASGKYVTKSAPTANFGASNPANDNVEEIAKSVLVLQGLNGKNYPSYVVAVLNCPTDLVNKLHSEQLSLAEVQKVLTDTESPYLNVVDNKNYFIMSNSTYNNNDATSKYFATKLVEDNFLKEQPEKEDIVNEGDGINVVDIYVERLAAKANLTLATAATDYVELTKYNVDGEARTLYVKVLNWKLNGTNKKSYLMKNVDEKFTAYTANTANGALAWDWNATANKRTYWGKSYNWGEGTYPAGWSSDLNVTNNTLNYFSWNAMTPEEGTTIGTAQYCAENTNSENFLNAGNFHSIITEALLQAEIYTENEDGEKVETELIRYNNTLYTKEIYVKQALLNLGKTWWTVNDDEETTDKVEYRSLADTDVEYLNFGNGIGALKLTNDAAALTWYSTEEPSDATKAEAEAINAELKKDIVKAEIYKDGMMYYNIPIEHLRGGEFTYVSSDNKPVTGDGSADTEPEDIRVNEADYGVVRNHYYNITVNSIANLGNAVLEPDEIIIPIDKNNTTYYVGANISILAWKVVNQGVNL